MQIWSEEDVLRLAGQDAKAHVTELLAEAGSPVEEREEEDGSAMAVRTRGGTAPWRRGWPSSSGTGVDMTFKQIEEVLGLRLPASSRKHQAHWRSYDGSAVARAILDAGWIARNVNLTAETVTFERR